MNGLRYQETTASGRLWATAQTKDINWRGKRGWKISALLQLPGGVARAAFLPKSGRDELLWGTYVYLCHLSFEATTMKGDFKGHCGVVGRGGICSGVRNLGFKFHFCLWYCVWPWAGHQKVSAKFADEVIHLAFKEDKIKQHFWKLLVNIYILYKHEYFPRGRRAPWVVVNLPSQFPQDLVSPPQSLLRNWTGAQLGYCWEKQF